jgi:hypothetical protein
MMGSGGGNRRTESIGAPRKRHLSKSSREPAPPSPSSSVGFGAPPISPATQFRQHVEDKLKDAELTPLASTVTAILRATLWNESLLNDPNSKKYLVADLEKPAKVWECFETMDAMKGVSKRSAQAVGRVARTIALLLLSGDAKNAGTFSAIKLGGMSVVIVDCRRCRTIDTQTNI